MAALPEVPRPTRWLLFVKNDRLYVHRGTFEVAMDISKCTNGQQGATAAAWGWEFAAVPRFRVAEVQEAWAKLKAAEEEGEDGAQCLQLKFEGYDGMSGDDLWGGAFARILAYLAQQDQAAAPGG